MSVIHKRYMYSKHQDSYVLKIIDSWKVNRNT